MKPKQAGGAGSSLLGGQDISSPHFRTLYGVHETFARALETDLSAFLQAEIRASLSEISFVTCGDFNRTLSNPTCWIVMRLHPGRETMVLHLESATVFTLLELLMGGKGDAAVLAPRELTEIEWSLLEEVIRVLVRPLGEAWRVFREVEFVVDSMGSDPARIVCPDPMRPVGRIVFQLQFDKFSGNFAIAVPQGLFDATAASQESEEGPPAPNQADVERNLGLLENAMVELEVKLQGPTLEFKDLMALKTGQILTFNYPLRDPIHASANGALQISGHIVGKGRKRAFQVQELP
ncbi:MAG: flagellar motor switch protein FliM [Bryobacteraceae bacterium]|jgi:flagellar motor switch protein FliM